MMVDSKNYNNVIQASYPMLLDMYKECCKKKSISAEFDRDALFYVGEKLFELTISMVKEDSQVRFSAVIDEYPNPRKFRNRRGEQA